MTLVEDRHLTFSSGQLFAESARRFFGNIKLGFHDDGATDAALTSAPLGPCRLSRIDASAHGVKASRVVQRSYDVDSIKCILQLDGHSSFEQDGRSYAFGPKSWIVYDPTRPYQLNNRSRISQLLLQVPRTNFSSAALERLSAPHVFRDDPVGVPRVVAAFARSTMDEIATFDELAGSRVGDTLARLATTMIATDEDDANSEILHAAHSARPGESLYRKQPVALQPRYRGDRAAHGLLAALHLPRVPGRRHHAVAIYLGPAARAHQGAPHHRQLPRRLDLGDRVCLRLLVDRAFLAGVPQALRDVAERGAPADRRVRCLRNFRLN